MNSNYVLTHNYVATTFNQSFKALTSIEYKKGKP